MLPRISFLLLLILSVHVAAFCAQDPTPSPSPQLSEASNNKSQESDPDRYLREGLKGVAEESRSLVGWGLALIGASVIGIASTSYFRPASTRVRLIYLLFIPGWILIGLSTLNGEKVSRRFAAAAFAQKHDRLVQIGMLMNDEFGNQLTYLQWGLGFFSMWLLLFILWWVFGDLPKRPADD